MYLISSLYFLGYPYGSQTELYVCQQCNKTYQRKGTLSRHIRWECGKEPSLECEKCHRMFFYRNDLMKHFYRKHNGDEHNQ